MYTNLYQMTMQIVLSKFQSYLQEEEIKTKQMNKTYFKK